MSNDTTRRELLAGFGALAAAPALADQAPVLIGEPAGRIAPRADLVNVPEFEEMARRQVAPSLFNAIGGSDREFFERITFRPRRMISSMQLDMSLQLFGEKMFAPIMTGPLSNLQAYHAEGEAGLARASSMAKAWMVVSSDSSVQLEKIVTQSSTILWYQVFPMPTPRRSMRARRRRSGRAAGRSASRWQRRYAGHRRMRPSTGMRWSGCARASTYRCWSRGSCGPTMRGPR